MSPQLTPRPASDRTRQLAGAQEIDRSPASRSKVVPGQRDAQDAAPNQQQEHAAGIKGAGRNAGLRFFLRFWSW
jgi:hypothetical protein